MISGPKKKLLDILKQRGRATIDECVAKVSLAKTTVREHLTQLERDNFIQRSYERTGRGRPSLQFKLSQKGNALYPSYEPKLMREFIAFLKKEEKDELLEEFFRNFWDQRFNTLQQMLEAQKATTDQDKIEVLSKMLEEEGFMPEIEKDPKSGELTIRECNCPFHEIVKESRMPCRLEMEFFEKVFDRKADRTRFIANGDFSCTYCIR